MNFPNTVENFLVGAVTPLLGSLSTLLCGVKPLFDVVTLLWGESPLKETVTPLEETDELVKETEVPLEETVTPLKETVATTKQYLLDEFGKKGSFLFDNNPLLTDETLPQPGKSIIMGIKTKKIEYYRKKFIGLLYNDGTGYIILPLVGQVCNELGNSCWVIWTPTTSFKIDLFDEDISIYNLSLLFQDHFFVSYFENMIHGLNPTVVAENTKVMKNQR